MRDAARRSRGEALVELDGRAIGGLNPFHRDHLLLTRAAGGETLQLRILASPKGLFGTPERTPALRALRLYVPDHDVGAVYEDLLASLDGAAQLIAMNRDPIAARVLDLLDEAFALIPWSVMIPARIWRASAGDRRAHPAWWPVGRIQL
ncbi:hypothetical protein ACFSC4_26195 [Deinococcus malanensis]|uniref:hypothetical protein n=1 Tax=Deinococcus malanensis TaxID=1706855 RepID=UPI00362D2A67